MNSIPARPQSQRRSSPEQSQTPSSQSMSSISPVRARSEDSQTIFVHKPDESQQEEQEQDQQAPSSTRRLDIDDDPTAKKCWICFSDSTEDTPETSPWRDPCPCALVAHEECLLDWIADTESPKNARNRHIHAPKLECPQCKSEIKLARPTDYLVDAVRGVERLTAKIVTPGAIFTLSSIVYSSSMAWGMHSVYTIFGGEDGHRVLQPLIDNFSRAPLEVYVGNPQDAAKRLWDVLYDHLVHWRLYVGLPLITPVLVLSRTSLGDGMLPVLPIFFFATQTHSPQESTNFAEWPPSASFVFALLPYVRSLYNAYYQRVWAEKEKRWLREVQPRHNSNANDDDAEGENNGQNVQPGAPAAPPQDEGENIFEVRIDRGIWEDWDDDDMPPQAAPAPNVPAAQQMPQQPAQPAQAAQNNAERRLSFSPTHIAETFLGALLFPTVAGLSGELLKLVLPSSWTSPVISSRFGSKMSPKSLLQQKWGRSIVGGCLFVVAKDAVMLYVRWRMAQMHRKRRVVDYQRKGRSS